MAGYRVVSDRTGDAVGFVAAGSAAQALSGLVGSSAARDECAEEIVRSYGCAYAYSIKPE